MKDWNKHLSRLVRRKMGDNQLSDDLQPLFQSISDAFDNHEKEYALLNRIMDLSSEELFSANEELRKRNEELDRFVYSTSHDLRAPLTSIMGLLQLIDFSEDWEEKKKYLCKIKQSTAQLDNFIQDIISYTHNKKVDLKYALVDFDELIRSCIEKLDFMNHTSKIDKLVDVQVQGAFFSDPKRLDILFSNLLSNSIKYHNPENPSPYVNIKVRDKNEGVGITIEDNGMGIKDEYQDKIFDMFYRASAQSKGSGIGLYIVKEIVEKLSGSITVTSKIKEGTSFFIYIPKGKRPE